MVSEQTLVVEGLVTVVVCAANIAKIVASRSVWDARTIGTGRVVSLTNITSVIAKALATGQRCTELQQKNQQKMVSNDIDANLANQCSHRKENPSDKVHCECAQKRLA